MRPEDWERAEQWFHRLAPLEPARRATMLAEVSSESPNLGLEIESLLAAHDSQGLLDRLAERIAPLPASPSLAGSMEGASVAHYEVVELVGRGGMGAVYRARDTRLGRDVALKFLPDWLSSDPGARDRFLVEARIVSSIDHPNVCALLEMGETDDGRLYLIMPYYEGETLKRRLARGPLPVDEALQVALQTTRGLAAAHARGIVHRDIKPANLLLTDGGGVKILDFGVAKLADVDLTRTGETPGTIVYMSPEQGAGRAVDARTDLWSLGVVLCEMLTGERPEPRSDFLGPVVPGAGSRVPRGVADVLSRLLARDPDARYPDARALAEGLAILASDSNAPAARPAASAQRLLAELKRRHVFKIAAVYGVAGFAVIEAADVMFPRVPLPEWTIGLVVWLTLLGFPIALVLAWAFETTPSGVRRTRKARPAILDAIVSQPAARRWPIGLAGLLGAALLIGAGGWWAVGDRDVVGRRGVPVTASVAAAGEAVAVLPFQISGEGEALRSWHEGIVHLLSANLETIEGLRKIDPALVMAAWEARDGRADGRADPKSIIELARSVGARYAISGSAVAVGTGNAMRLLAEVRDVETGTFVGSETMEVPIDSPTSADRLAMALLQEGLLPVDSEPGGLRDLARVSTRSFPAFTAYLEGERRYRRGEYEAAATSFVRASELDSTFARAMYRAAQSYMWILNFDLEDEYRHRAARLAARLPGSELSRRDSLLFTGFPYDLGPAAIPDLERFTRMYPDDLDGWFNLGDAYVHLGGRGLHPASDYRRALAKAVDLGGSYKETYVHLIEDGFARRDREAVRAALDRYAVLGDGFSACPGYELAFTGAWGDDATVAEQVPATGDSDLECAWVTLAASGAATEELERRHLDLVEAGEAGIPLFWRLAQARVMRGELDRTMEIQDVASAAGFEEWAARNVVMFSLIGLTDAPADAATDLLAAQVPGHSTQTGAHVGWFWLGAQAVEEGRWDDVEAAARNLELAADTIRMAVVGEGPARARRVQRFAEGADQLAATLRAYTDVMRGGNEALGKFEDELGREYVPSFIVSGPAQYLQFRMGLELFERGDPRASERYLLSLYPYAWAVYVPAQYHLGRVYEELGQPERAREHYRIFVEWWETADAALQPWVDDGRAALERLGAAARGTSSPSS